MPVPNLTPPRKAALARAWPHALGFTLVEVLMALAVLAIMAGMSWQAVDALLRTQERNERSAQSTHLLHSTLQQWEADLNALAETGVVSAIDFDGKRLRLTRRDPLQPGLGVRVVVWSLENRAGQSTLVRWQSPLVGTRGTVESAWRQALQTGSARPGEIRSLPAAQWQLFYFRRNAWVNPLSANEQADAEALAAQAAAVADAARRAAAGLSGEGIAPVPANSATPNSNLGLVPDGVRLQLNPSTGSAASGSVTKDWIRPQWTPS